MGMTLCHQAMALFFGEQIMNKRLLVSVLGIAATVMVSGSAFAVWMADGGERDEALHLKPNDENGIEVFEVCAACHLTEGWGSKDGTFPQIAGQHQRVLVKQLADIREGNRDNPTMYPFAKPESIGGPQAMADVTHYMAQLPMNPDWGKGEWEEGTPEYEKGKKLYEENCVKCHGKLGNGGTRAAPDLAESKLNPGQFRKQIKKGSKWKTRDMKHPRYRWKKMPAQRNLSDEEIERLDKYILSN